MKYYLIAGEASGDLHASHLMKALAQRDAEAEFRFVGGDLMQSVGGTLVRHYRTLAYMGFVPVITHVGTILRGMRQCRRDVLAWQPDVLILVDYPGFNLGMAKFASQRLPGTRVVYYISPKVWAWKEWRMKDIRKYVDQVLSILPFEVDFYRRHDAERMITYVGNPTLDEVAEYKEHNVSDFPHFIEENGLPDRPVIALLAGSRRQEIGDNLRRMIQAVEPLSDRYQFVVAGAPGITDDVYRQVLGDAPVRILYGQTYRILQHATAALVTSGTATLETALFRVPQVVCYYLKAGFVFRLLRWLFIKVPFISLVNLVAGREVVPELVGSDMTPDQARQQLLRILPDGEGREAMLRGYDEVARRLGAPGAPQHAADCILRSAEASV